MLKSAWKKICNALPSPIFRRKKASYKEPVCFGCDDWIHEDALGDRPLEPTVQGSSPESRPPVDSSVSKPLPPLPMSTPCYENIGIAISHNACKSRYPTATPVVARPPSDVGSRRLWHNFFRQSIVSSTNTTSTSHDLECPGSPHLTIPTPPISKKSRPSHRKRLGVILSPELVANGLSKFADTEKRVTVPDPDPTLPNKTPSGLAILATTTAPVDTSQSSVAQPVRIDTIRVHVPSPSSLVLPERIHSGIKPLSASRQLGLFSADLQVKMIGSGCSGNVFKVTRNTSHGKIVRAVKLIDLTQEDDEGLRVYADEVRTLKALRQQDMCYGRAEDDKWDENDSHSRGLKYIMKLSPQDKFVGICGNAHLYIIMEHYPLMLSDFRGFVAEDGLSLQFIISQVTKGLEFLHSIGIIHMDLKPENIFVTEMGNCVIGDFGGSVNDPSTPSHVYRSARDLAFWTPGYVSPEAIDACDPKVNHMADFWSLGVTIYDLVVVPPEFNGNFSHLQLGLESFMMAHKMNMYGCPRHIWFTVMGMCEEIPEKRWDGKTILDYLDKHYPPLPSSSPLLKYNFSGSRRQGPLSEPRVMTEPCVNPTLKDYIIGSDIHLTERITASYIR